MLGHREFYGGVHLPHYDDLLGDGIKSIEATESLRAAAPGEPVVVRVDGASFSNFTKPFARPFDERIFVAMDAAARKVTEEFNCRLSYTQSDEITFLLWHPTTELPFGGRLQKLASRIAAKTTAAFLLKGLELFPNEVSRLVPEFDGRATAFPGMEEAARVFLWRELDARKNAVSMAARACFPAGSLNGKSSTDMKAMMLDAGMDFRQLPQRFRRGAFFRWEAVERTMTAERLAAIPERHRPTAPVRRSAVVQADLPPLTMVDNLAEVVFHGAEPIVVERRFAEAVYG